MLPPRASATRVTGARSSAAGGLTLLHHTLTLTFGLTLEPNPNPNPNPNSNTTTNTHIPAHPRFRACYHARHDTLTIPGRLVALLDRSGHVIDPPHADLSARRCASGTPLRSAGMVDAPRPLVGGCAREGDASYDASAEVHVPQVLDVSSHVSICLSTCLHCSTSLHLSIVLPIRHLPPQACVEPLEAEHVGCMMPTALNYDSRALQPSARCRYVLRGCTRSSALNYNPEASEDDGSCVARVAGCTLRPEGYAGVDGDTPGYKSLSVGVPRLGVGVVAWPSYGSVLNYNQTATTLEGCVPAIEGCMDSSALNYDPDATIDSNGWCVASAVDSARLCMKVNRAMCQVRGRKARLHAARLGGRLESRSPRDQPRRGRDGAQRERVRAGAPRLHLAHRTQLLAARHPGQRRAVLRAAARLPRRGRA